MKKRFKKIDHSVEENARENGMKAMLIASIVAFAGGLGAYWGLKTGMREGSEFMEACWKAVNHELMDQGILTDDQICDAIDKAELMKKLIV